MISPLCVPIAEVIGVQDRLALTVYLLYCKGVSGYGSGHMMEVAPDAFDTMYPTMVLLQENKTQKKMLKKNWGLDVTLVKCLLNVWDSEVQP